MAGMPDRLIHSYAAVDYEIIWTTVSKTDLSSTLCKLFYNHLSCKASTFNGISVGSRQQVFIRPSSVDRQISVMFYLYGLTWMILMSPVYPLITFWKL